MQPSLLRQLIDFTDLKRKQEEFNTVSSGHSSGHLQPDMEAETNQIIIKSLKELREKLKSTQRQNHDLQQQNKALQLEVLQLQESEHEARTLNLAIRDKQAQTQLALDEAKKKIYLVKQQLTKRQQLESQLQYLKGNVMELHMLNEKLEEEKKKLVQISIQDKLSLEESMNKLLAKSNSDEAYLQEMEMELAKARETILKLENKLKKLQIKYDEEVFSKKWDKDNFQKERYEARIKQLQEELIELKNKQRKDKERRTQIEKRVIQLEQLAGLCNVKAEAYQGEVGLIATKLKKMERRMSQAKVSAAKQASQRATWEQRFCKAVLVAEELISRVKRQLMGDMVELAKACEFKINKLKEADLSKSRTRLESTLKNQPKSGKKQRPSTEKELQTTFKDTERERFASDAKGILVEAQTNLKTVASKGQEQKSQKKQSAGAEIDCLQLKIRREREEMEKKLKEKMLFRKIDVCSTPEKARLREDYLKLIFQR